jgi:hypothetical protein
MGLADSITKHTKLRGIDAVAVKLSAEDAADLRAALADPSIGHTAIARGLKDYGIDISEAGVRRWRERIQPVDGL